MILILIKIINFLAIVAIFIAAIRQFITSLI